jgi:hypothetical protein
MFSNAIEELESRTLFNTITNNGIGTGTFEYKDGTGQIVRVVYHNVVAELVFARVSATTNQVVLGDATPSFATEDGKDLFHIYVASAGPIRSLPSRKSPRSPRTCARCSRTPAA